MASSDTQTVSPRSNNENLVRFNAKITSLYHNGLLSSDAFKDMPLQANTHENYHSLLLYAVAENLASLDLGKLFLSYDTRLQLVNFACALMTHVYCHLPEELPHHQGIWNKLRENNVWRTDGPALFSQPAKRNRLV